MVPVLARPAERAATDRGRRPPGPADGVGPADLDHRHPGRRSAWRSRWRPGRWPACSTRRTAGPTARRPTWSTVTGHMLAVFAPQIVLYGLAVVLYGILQAHRRFAAPALAPVISSLVVIAAYLAFVPLGAGARQRAGRAAAGRRADAVGRHHGRCRRAGPHSAGPGLAATDCGLRPALRFPAGVGAGWRAGRLRDRGAGGAGRLGSSSSWLANGRGSRARSCCTVRLAGIRAAYAVLAISIAISAFPVLSARDGAAEFDQTAAGSVRAVLLMSFLGAALLAAMPAAQACSPRPGAGAAAGAGPGAVRARPRRLRARRLPVPGAARGPPHRAAARGHVRRLADRHRRRRRAGRAVPGRWVVAMLAWATPSG